MKSRMLEKLAPLTAAMIILASAAAHAQLGTGSPNPGMPGMTSPMTSSGPSPGVTSPGLPTETPGMTNPRVSNYGAGGMQRVPGSPPRFH